MFIKFSEIESIEQLISIRSNSVDKSLTILCNRDDLIEFAKDKRFPILADFKNAIRYFEIADSVLFLGDKEVLNLKDRLNNYRKIEISTIPSKARLKQQITLNNLKIISAGTIGIITKQFLDENNFRIFFNYEDYSFRVEANEIEII